VVRNSFRSARLARVDDAAGTIQQLDLPTQVDWWAETASDELLWGVANGCVVYWQQPGGDFAHRDLDCRPESEMMLYSEPPFAARFTAKRMAALELGGTKGLPVALHVTLDRGATWRRIPVTEDTINEVLAQQR
jgi:hypothetical protein